MTLDISYPVLVFNLVSYITGNEASRTRIRRKNQNCDRLVCECDHPEIEPLGLRVAMCPIISSRQKMSCFLLLLAVALFNLESCAAQITPWINEFHYRPKQNMFIEIAGPANQSANGLQVTLYQGRDGLSYPPAINMTGLFFDQGVEASVGIGFMVIPLSWMRKGNRVGDGIALSTPTNPCYQFISYGGNFTAHSGICAGIRSNDVGVSEPRHSVAGKSVQLRGSGMSYQSFTWWNIPKASTPGEINQGQSFTTSVVRRLR